MAKSKKGKSGAKKKGGSKAKTGGKGKSGSKGKKGGSKGSSSKKGAKASKKQSSSLKHTAGSSTAASSALTTSSETSSTNKSAADSSATGFPKPLNRPMLPPLILPYDVEMPTLTRQPSPIVVWEWGNVWFYPVGVLAVALVVIGMIFMSISIQDMDMQADLEKHNSSTLENVTTPISESPPSTTEHVSVKRTTARRTSSRTTPREKTSPVTSSENFDDGLSSYKLTQATGPQTSDEELPATITPISTVDETQASGSQPDDTATDWLMRAPIKFSGLRVRLGEALKSTSNMAEAPWSDIEENTAAGNLDTKLLGGSVLRDVMKTSTTRTRRTTPPAPGSVTQSSFFAAAVQRKTIRAQASSINYKNVSTDDTYVRDGRETSLESPNK